MPKSSRRSTPLLQRVHPGLMPFALLLCGAAGAGIAIGRGGKPAPPATVAYAATKQVPSSPTPKPKPTLPPNELGRIPVLMYHSVGDAPSRSQEGLIRRLGLNIPPSKLRAHLDMMREAGFYPVNMRDIFDPHFSIPAGKSPVVLTFDDARASQFRYRKDGTIDPNCVVGILEAFHKKHPEDWPERAVFYVLPDTRYNPPPFGSRDQVKKKFDYLVDHGYEIANHSTKHHAMRHMSAKEMAWEMATCAQYVKKITPKATMDTMALPYGSTPPRSMLPVLLSDGSGRYHNKCVLLAGGNPSYAPMDKRFDRLAVMRVGSEPGNIEAFMRLLAKGRRVGGQRNTYPPYISDGDPDTLTYPQSFAKYLDKKQAGSLRLVAYADTPAQPKTKPKAVAHAGGKAKP